VTGRVRTSSHFRVEALAPGVFAAIADRRGGGVSNAGIIDLGGQTLVFDTGMTPPASRDLLAAAEELTGRAPAIVVNSHWHDDHHSGNTVFGGATVYAT